MYKSTARAEQFMERRGSFSTHGTRGGADLLGGGEKEQMTPEQERAALVAAIVGLESTISRLNQLDREGMPLMRKQALNAEIKKLGHKKFEIQSRITELLPLIKGRYKADDLGDFIIQVVRESMTKPQWAGIVTEAKRRFDAQGAADEAPKPAAES